MKKILSKVDIRSLVVGIIIGLIVGLAIFSALVPSGIDMMKLYYPNKVKSMMNGQINVDRSNK